MNIEQLIKKYKKEWDKYGMGSSISYSQVVSELEQIQEEIVNIEEKIYQALRKHKLPLKKREELMPDLLTLFSEILNKQK